MNQDGVANGTHVLAILGGDLAQDDDRWLGTDFILFHHLIAAKRNNSTWLTACDIDPNVYGDFIIGEDSADHLKVNPGEGWWTTVREQGLSPQFLHELAKKESHLPASSTLIIVICAHAEVSMKMTINSEDKLVFQPSFIVGEEMIGKSELESVARKISKKGCKIHMLTDMSHPGAWESDYWNLITLPPPADPAIRVENPAYDPISPLLHGHEMVEPAEDIKSRIFASRFASFVRQGTASALPLTPVNDAFTSSFHVVRSSTSLVTATPSSKSGVRTSTPSHPTMWDDSMEIRLLALANEIVSKVTSSQNTRSTNAIVILALRVMHSFDSLSGEKKLLTYRRLQIWKRLRNRALSLAQTFGLLGVQDPGRGLGETDAAFDFDESPQQMRLLMEAEDIGGMMRLKKVLATDWENPLWQYSLATQVHPIWESAFWIARQWDGNGRPDIDQRRWVQAVKDLKRSEDPIE